MSDHIHLQHGDGGRYTNQLIHDLFYKAFHTPLEQQGKDAAILELTRNPFAYTTDSFVIKPIFFSGGDIGKLAVIGTLNDLAVSGAKPLFLSLALIIEEGFNVDELKKIITSIGETCEAQSVQIVTGDTKVVEKGSVDQIFINTSGIGQVLENYQEKELKPGDEIIVTGGIGEHGAAIAIERFDLKIKGKICSDLAPIFPIINGLNEYLSDIKLMKDPTRGGIASVFCEIAQKYNVGIELEEKRIPISNEVGGIARLLGFDPLYLACEGRALMVVEAGKGEEIVRKIRQGDTESRADIIGRIIDEDHGMVLLKTMIGGTRIIRLLETPILPRIC